ncbi:Protein-tyrosine-phosphatase IBR5 [Linum grandiflorum]
MMRKRERENPCGICGHYHKYDEGELCGICGHRMPDSFLSAKFSSLHISVFPSEILPDFLYLGSYDNASRSELLQTQGITQILNVDQCERDKARILVHCMSGKSRSPAIVIAYLMKSKGWRLAQSYQWVKERRPSVELAQGVHQQLKELEQKLFSAACNSKPAIPVFPAADDTKPSPATSTAPFSSPVATSILTLPLEVPPHEFQFGAVLPQSSPVSGNTQCPNSGDSPMDR